MMEATVHAKAWDPGKPRIGPMVSLCGLESWILLCGKAVEAVTCDQCLHKMAKNEEERRGK